MATFELHTIDTAPEGSRADMNAVQAKFGFLPNIYGVFAESPSVIKAYIAMTDLLDKSAFTPAEAQLTLLTISAENGCDYCVAAHTMVGKMVALDDQVIEAVRTGLPIPDKRLGRLHHFTKTMVANRGHVSAEEVDAFIADGFTKAQALDVALATALKTMSNYINHFADTPLDEAFEPARWQPAHAAE